jgi:hypothetical protein
MVSRDEARECSFIHRQNSRLKYLASPEALSRAIYHTSAPGTQDEKGICRLW